jgi:ribonuclease BN (tRNA processing enzyme)
MRRFGVDPNSIGTVLISHLHGDHFAGLPYLLLDAQYVSGRKVPLTIAGPPGLASRLHALREAMFPDSTSPHLPFRLEIVELEAEQRTAIGGLHITPFEVRHPSGAPSFALRCEVAGRTICYSGDTEWVGALGRAAHRADLFIAETFTYDRPVPFHTAWTTLHDHLAGIGAKRVLLTHMSADMLGRDPPAGVDLAEDGMVIDF